MRVTMKSHLSKRGKYELYHVSVDIIDTQSNTSMLCKKWVACSWTLSFVCLVIWEWFIFQKGNEKEHISSYAWHSIAAQTKYSPKILFWVNAGLLVLPCIGWSYLKRTPSSEKKRNTAWPCLRRHMLFSVSLWENASFWDLITEETKHSMKIYPNFLTCCRRSLCNDAIILNVSFCGLKN